MKKFVFLFALLGVATSAPALLSARPVEASAKVLAVRTYGDGFADGTDMAAAAAAQYGYQSAEYNSYISAQAANAQYNATHSEEPTYWRGVRTGLVNY
jgi:hypothetical protein